MPVRMLDNSPPSQTFAGTLNVSLLQKDEAWRINISIQGYDLEHGYLSGTMEALNVPLADTPVVTFWEGEIVDIKNYTFFTGKWERKRWKEQYFVNVGIDCGLTITGFYYVCFSFSGSINGFYYDPNISPFQKLEMNSTNEELSEFSFSSYQLQ